METKLTRQDVEGFRDIIIRDVKMSMLKQLEGEMAIKQLSKMIRKMPKK